MKVDADAVKRRIVREAAFETSQMRNRRKSAGKAVWKRKGGSRTESGTRLPVASYG